MSKKTLYVTDLDKTLMRNDKSISKYTVDTFNRLIDEGYFLTYATARSVVSAKAVTEDIHFQLPIITKNGTVLASQETGEDTEIIYFTEEEKQSLLRVLQHKGLCGIITEYRDGKELKKYFTGRRNVGLEAYLENHKDDNRMYAVEEEALLYDGRLSFFVYIASEEELRPIYEEVKKECKCTTVFQKDQYREEFWLEILPIQASKASAILKVKERYGLDEVVCFGDSLNDLSMFEIADRAYAVSNAMEEVKAAATAIIGSNEEDGVAKFIERDIDGER